VGASKAIGELKDQLARLAQADLPVLVTGASGSGKELAVRALYLGSEWREEPFVVVNCAVLPV
jgi:DNA-binding NtrC family response regulator